MAVINNSINAPIPFTVPKGGTGNTTFTAFSVICAGTTATGAFQNVVGVGSIGQVLTSAGPGAIPTWTNAPGTGTVNSGLINELAYYAAGGTAVSGLATANNGLLVTSNTGVPSILAGPGTTGNVLQSNAAAAPSFSTATYPSTTTINRILFSSAANVVGEITTANSAWLITNGSGVPSFNTTLPFNQITVQVFTSSGTYTPTAGMKYCIIECVGGGGAGGGAAQSGAGGQDAGGGGGSGSYSRKISTAATIGVSQTVTIGNGGTAGSVGNNPGGNGGDTSVGVICIGKGGTGGNGNASNSFTLGGNGGVAGTGDITLIGNNGFVGGGGSVTNVFIPSGEGGNSIYGPGAQPLASNGTGNAAAAGAYGAGGSGGLSSGASAAVAGGAGAKGIVIVTEYLSV